MGVYALGGLLHRYRVTLSEKCDNMRSELCVTRFSFDRNKHEFATPDLPVISYIIAHENITICTCQTAVEHKTGITKVYFLLGDVSKAHLSGTCTFYLCVISASRVLVVGKVTLVTDTKPEQVASVSITDGPNVCVFTHSGNLYYTWPSAAGETVELFFVTIPPRRHLTSLLWCGCDDSATQLIAIGICVQHPDAMETSSDVGHSVMAIAMGRGKQGQNTSTTLDSSDIIAPQYASIMLCIYIKWLTIKSLDENMHYCETNAGDMQMSPVSVSALACTSYSQLLLFEKGRLLKFGALPFDNADKIVVFETSLDSEYIAVHSTRNIVCLILATTFEVVRVIDGVAHILVDDFVGCGSEQVLLLPHQESDTTGKDRCPHQFLLTDFSSCHANTLQEEDVGGLQGDLGESLQGVARALETRVQMGYQCLADAERHSALKARLITQSCDAARRMTSRAAGIHVPRLDPHLVSLVQGAGTEIDRCDDATAGSDDAPRSDSALGSRDTQDSAQATVAGDWRLTATWQRIVYDNWVVSAVVTNVSTCAILMPRLCLVSVDDDPVATETHCTCSVDGCARVMSPGEPLQKVSRSSKQTSSHCVLPEESATLSACHVGLPRFTKTRQRKFALTIIYEKQTESGESETKGTHQNASCDEQTKGSYQKCVASDCVGYVELTVDDLLDGSLNVDITTKNTSAINVNTVSLNAAQTRYSLQVKCRHGNVVDAVTNALHQDLKFVCQDASHICILAGPLYLVRASGGEVTSQLVGEVTVQFMNFVVYARDESQLLLFLHAIMAVLPDDVTIMAPSHTGSIRASIDKVITNMRLQTTYCCEELRSLIMNAESKSDSVSPSEQLPQRGRKQSVDAIREEFACIQQQVQRSADGKCDEEKLRVFREEVKRLGKATDAALVELVTRRESRF